MGGIRYLIADLYFYDRARRLTDPEYLQNLFEQTTREWSQKERPVRLVRGPAEGWCGICPLINGRLTFQTMPQWGFMSIEIVSFEHNPDPKILGELLIAELEPAVVTMDTVLRGNHLPN